MLSNNSYRKLILASYYRMISTQMAYTRIGLDICLLDELKILDGFMEGEHFHPDAFETIKDVGVRRIHRFLKETEPITSSFQEINSFLKEEIDTLEDPLMPAYDGKADRHILLFVLLVYTDKDVSELATLINELCELNGYPPITDYENADFYEDENVRLIASFYKKVLELFDEFKDEVFEEEDKRNKLGE